jgi:glutamate transport system substrate-binding protein
MRRRLILVATGLAVLATVAGCGNNSTSTTGGGASAPSLPAGTAKTIQDRGKIIIGTKFDQPGFGSKSLGGDTPEGFDVEVGKIIARSIFGSDIDDKIEFVETQSSVREDFIDQGKVDLIAATYSITDKRKERVSFAGPYLIAGQSLLVKKDDNSIKGPDNLAGKRVCSVIGSTPLERIKELAPDANYDLLFKGYADCVGALDDGRIDAVTTDDQILLGYAAEKPNKFKVVGAPFSQELYGIGVKKDDKAFRDFINDQLEKAYADGSWKKAYESTLGEKNGTPAPTPPPVARY